MWAVISVAPDASCVVTSILVPSLSSDLFGIVATKVRV